MPKKRKRTKKPCYCTHCNGALVDARIRQLHRYRYELLSVEDSENQTQETSDSLSTDIKMGEQDNEQENDKNCLL